ncbi:hydroxyethylthiazole kinase [Blautia obeum]|uniref:hydroxyethylthiazole kinase n=1 Tax=Blautia obeum TaxID=40520 RepID=UPI003564E57D
MNRNEILNAILKKHPKIHCLTNPVTMNDVANILLAAGGSAVMAQDEQEAAEITTFCQGTLLNTGVPDEGKIRACILAGKRANQLGHPVILDPVGVGGSSFRQRELKKLLEQVHPSIVRCNADVCFLHFVPCSAAVVLLLLKPLPQPVRSGRRFRKKPVHVSIRTAAASDSSMRCSWMWPRKKSILQTVYKLFK